MSSLGDYSIVCHKTQNTKKALYMSQCLLSVSVMPCFLPVIATVMCVSPVLFCGNFGSSSTCVVGRRMCIIQPSPNMSSVTILVISCQKKNSGSYSTPPPPLKSVHAHGHTQTQTGTHFRLCPSSPPHSLLSLTHIHARKHTLSLLHYTLAHTG